MPQLSQFASLSEICMLLLFLTLIRIKSKSKNVQIFSLDGLPMLTIDASRESYDMGNSKRIEGIF